MADPETPSAPQTPGTPGIPLFTAARIDSMSYDRKSMPHCNNCLSVNGWVPSTPCFTDFPRPTISLTRKLGAEFVGTFILIFFATAAPIVNQKYGQPTGLIGNAGSAGLAVMIVILATGAASESSSVSGTAAADFSEQSDSSLHFRRDADSLSAASLRSEEYRQLFHLPPEEVLVQDFNCAFQENILLQGHMYLFVHHICFYSNIFGFETKKMIPFHEVTCVRKAKTAAIFHNAIEIVAGDKKYFFASFLSRDEAYRLIVDGWSQHSTSAKIFLENQEAKPESSGQDNVLIFFEKLKNFKRSTNDLDSVDRSKDAEVTEECTRLSNGEIDVAVSAKLSKQQDDREENVASVSSKACSTRNPGDEDAPKIPDYYTMVAESEFPIQVEEFYNNFFSDGALDFVEAFHKKCGDKEFRCTPWYEHEQFGHARDLSFQHPIKIYFGAKYGQCQEVQKFRFYKNSHLVVETSQQITGVPYADFFRVEGIWDIEQGSQTSCVLRVYVNVAFSRKTLFKGKIEQSTMEECREAYAIWISNAQELLKQKQTSATSEGVVESAINTAHDDGYHMRSSGKREGLLEELSENRSTVRVLHQSSLSKEKQMNNPVEIGLGAAASCISLFKELWSSLCLYLKNQNLFSVAVVAIFVLLFLVMQMTIIILLTREPKIHLIPQENFLGGLNSNRAEAVAWLEKRVHHLKEEMFMVEARLEKMRFEYVLLKSYLHGLDQHESKP